jgi:hypothetical protein
VNFGESFCFLVGSVAFHRVAFNRRNAVEEDTLLSRRGRRVAAKYYLDAAILLKEVNM